MVDQANLTALTDIFVCDRILIKMHQETQPIHFATDTTMHIQSEKRYLEFSAGSHIYRSLFYIC